MIRFWHLFITALLSYGKPKRRFGDDGPIPLIYFRPEGSRVDR